MSELERVRKEYLLAKAKEDELSQEINKLMMARSILREDRLELGIDFSTGKINTHGFSCGK